MIDAKTAAAIAKEAGLGLPDAQALSRLAEDEAQARELAAMFKPEAKPTGMNDWLHRAYAAKQEAQAGVMRSLLDRGKR